MVCTGCPARPHLSCHMHSIQHGTSALLHAATQDNRKAIQGPACLPTPYPHRRACSALSTSTHRASSAAASSSDIAAPDSTSSSCNASIAFAGEGAPSIDVAAVLGCDPLRRFSCAGDTSKQQRFGR